MLKRFLGKSLGSKGDKEAPSGQGSDSQASTDLDQLRTLIEFFPIGKRLSYSPEFKKEIVFDTFVLAYCVDGKFIYSGEAIDRDAQGYPTGFRAGKNGEKIPASGPKLFQLLVPDTSHLEVKLDYQRRALIGRGRQFNKGNYISLISNAGGKGVSTVDTVVAKRIFLQDGPYARTKMILLTPELQTLAVTDQRTKARAKTCAPATVSLLEENFTGLCTIVDMSEGAVRIRVRDRDTTMRAIERAGKAILDFDLGAAERHYTIKGTIIRRSAETCVIQLEELIKDGKLCSFDSLDLLELKAVLLNAGQ